MRRFAFRLAMALGARSVRHLLSGMGLDEFKEWIAFDRLERLTDGKMEWYLSQIACYTAHGENVDDYIWKLPTEELPMTADEIKEQLGPMEAHLKRKQ